MYVLAFILPPRETETYREGVQFTTHDRGGLRLSTLGYGMAGWQGSRGRGYYMSNKHLTIKNSQPSMYVLCPILYGRMAISPYLPSLHS